MIHSRKAFFKKGDPVYSVFFGKNKDRENEFSENYEKLGDRC